MDFMVSLPPSKGFDVIMLVVDWFSRMAHFIPIKENAMTQEMRRLFFTHMFKHHGLPKDIVLRSQVHKYIFTNLVKAHGVEAQDEHFIPTPNIWVTQKCELGYPTILRNYVATDQQD